ncbi:hypothetical protein PP640_gp33 [Arthrobacter phage Faja]|uniref:Uncharacterized protein n=1 Tax=Arthrobacter phage Faja TaxID=2419957 RepID=A0A3G2KFX3_9CAUD|nr:hypothetical protein PP640_gp33 [Arthrobacter phage Faja]AYN57886.1 hypothetical protein PBI_FAJA_33 [Arthrobacter phage Faja]
MTIAPAEPTADLMHGPSVCPACSHRNDSAGRNWWDKLRGKTKARCRHTTVEADGLADDVDVCTCTDPWHQ